MSDGNQGLVNFITYYSRYWPVVRLYYHNYSPIITLVEPQFQFDPGPPNSMNALRRLPIYSCYIITTA